jgi:hypothetical protein
VQLYPITWRCFTTLTANIALLVPIIAGRSLDLRYRDFSKSRWKKLRKVYSCFRMMMVHLAVTISAIGVQSDIDLDWMNINLFVPQKIQMLMDWLQNIDELNCDRRELEKFYFAS